MTPLDAYNVALLALVMYREAAGEGLLGMRLVGHVIRNRKNAWNKTWFAVITGTNQFSSISVPGDGQLTKWLDPHSQLGKDILELACAIYKNEGEESGDLTKGALYYYNPKTATSGWFVENIVNKPEDHPLLFSYGSHDFFG